MKAAKTKVKKAQTPSRTKAERKRQSGEGGKKKDDGRALKNGP